MSATMVTGYIGLVMDHRLGWRTRWPGSRLPGGQGVGPGGRVARWPGSQVARWPCGQVAGWPGGRVARQPGRPGSPAGGARWPGGQQPGGGNVGEDHRALGLGWPSSRHNSSCSVA